MFIIKLFRHSKGMFFSFAAFVLLFLFINYKWGLVATPVLQYGMYSGKYHLADTITFYRIAVNAKPLDPLLLSQDENDNIQNYLDQYNTYEETNRVAFNTMRTYLDKLGLMSFANYRKFNMTVPGFYHYSWLKNKIQVAVDDSVHEFSAGRQPFIWSRSALQPVDTTFKILFVDTP